MYDKLRWRRTFMTNVLHEQVERWVFLIDYSRQQRKQR